MNKNFDTALKKALEKEFEMLDDFENHYSRHDFSSQFESKIKTIIPKAELAYVSIGRMRIRRTMLVALIALLAFTITGCAVAAHYIIEWHEEQNSRQGTLDINFELNEGPHTSREDTIYPETPQNYSIVSEEKDGFSRVISYMDDEEHQIIFTQYNDIEQMGLSIDNEDASFEKVTVNGQKGYADSREGIQALYWADSTYFYVLQGTCKIDVLRKMSESIAQ